MGVDWTINFKEREIGCQEIISQHVMMHLDTTHDYDPSLKAHFFQAIYKYMVANLGNDVSYRHPDGWWEWTKEKFFPQWLKLRYPVRQKVITFDAIYPGINFEDLGFKGRGQVFIPVAKMYEGTNELELAWRKEKNDPNA